ncbi:nSTAND1 domain-containing NTPase [Streptomyces sp. NPDC002519]
MGTEGPVGGGGFLVSEDLVLTCAHVVSDALGRPREDDQPPGTEVMVDLPLRDGGRAVAQVEHWIPVRGDQTGDVAVLRLRDALPAARPLTMVEADQVWGHEVRVPGFPHRFPGGVWHAGRLRGRTAERWIQLSQADDTSVAIEGGFSGSPAWDEELRAVVGMVVTAQLGGARQSFLIPTQTVVRELPALTAVLSPGSPFRGLSTFQEADRDVYFGREEEVAAVVALLRGESPSVTVVGPSGCGKSSLALAGVVPELRRIGQEIVVLRAGKGASIHSLLASELAGTAHAELRGAARLAEVEALEVSLRQRGLAQTFRLALGASASGLLVVVDQAEELLTGPQQAVRDVAEVLFPVPAPDDVRVLLTLRADFMETALSDPWMGPALARGAVRPLTAMSRRQLEEVVTKPIASMPAVTYEAGLVERLLDDTGDEPGALPLLGFVLARLWRERSAGRMRFATYGEIGGVRGALGRHAERVWRDRVRAEDEEEALGLLTSLVRLLPGGEAPLRHVLTRDEAGTERWRLAQLLAGERLLVTGSDPSGRQTVELAHEALIGAWPRLAERVRVNRDFLAWRAALRVDVDRWKQHGQAAEQLLRGEPLKKAQQQLQSRARELTAEERQYIEDSAHRQAEQQGQERRRARQKRWAITALVGLTVVALVASALYVARNRELDGQLRQAASEQLAARAEQLDDVSVVTSALLASTAFHTADGPQARTALIEEFLRLRNVDRIVLEGKGMVRDIAMTEDGSRVQALLDDGETLDVKVTQGGTRAVHGVVGSSRLAALSPDGRMMARATSRGLVSLGVRTSPDGSTFRVKRLRTVADVRKNARGATVLAFDGSGGRLLAALPREGVRVWDTSTGHQVGRALPAPGGWEVAQAWFGPADDQIIGRVVPQDSTGDDGAQGRLVRWNLGSGVRTAGPSGTRAIGKAAVSGDGRTLVGCTSDGVLQVWDLTGSAKPAHQYGPQQISQICPLYAPRLDRTGRYLLNPVSRIGSQLARLQLLVLDLQSGHRSVIELPGASELDRTATGEDQVPAVALAGEPGNLKVALSTGGTVVTARIPVPTAFDSAMLTSLVKTADADTARVATVDPDGNGLRLWDMRSHRQLAGVRPPRPLARQYAAFTPDGTRLLTTSQDARVVLEWNLPDLSPAGHIDVPLPPGTDPAAHNTLTGLMAASPALTFTDDDHVVISAASYVSRWNVKTGRQEGESYRPPVQEPVDISAAAANTIGIARPRHAQAALSVLGDKVVLWDFDSGDQVAAIPVPAGTVKQLGFDPTGRYLAILTYDGQVLLRDVDHNRWLPDLAHTGVLWLTAFSSPQTLGVQSTKNEYVVWNVPDRTERYRFPLANGVTGDISRDGRLLADIEGSDAVLLPLDPEQWKDRLCRLAGRDLTRPEKDLTPAGSRTDGVCAAGAPD